MVVISVGGVYRVKVFLSNEVVSELKTILKVCQGFLYGVLFHISCVRLMKYDNREPKYNSQKQAHNGGGIQLYIP